MRALAPTIEAHGRLTPDEVRRVRALVTAATEADGVSPLSEHVLLHLPSGGDAPGRHLLAYRDDALVGYAHLDVTDVVAGSSAELAVLPAARGRGVGGALVEALVAASPDGRLRLWAHGEHPAAGRLAERYGFVRTRVLWQMRRSLYAPLPAPSFPPDVTVRTFVVGRDEAAWTEVNNAAFAAHPEQGRWSVEEIRLREQEPWFDPAGFFLAERAGRLVGFHWTKVHGGDGAGPAPGVVPGHGHPPIGEVYVVGVLPEHGDRGLGRALTLVGLRHLRALGLAQAMLYVDGSNTRAIRVYEGLGFTRWDADVSYARATR
ncbi:MAG TPA: mycothiol synthase [Frankiaceae bacterium]|nr:mycothiol synthase [Frankiaceae bacterium]